MADIGRLLGGLVAGASKGAPGGIRAYHASPHDFKLFDMSKVGTGIGHAYRGEGMNFTTNEAKALATREQYFPQGHVYETNLNVDPRSLLQLESLLSGQPGVQRALDLANVDPGAGVPAFMRKRLTGYDALQALENVATPEWRRILADPTISTPQQATRKHLLKTGVPGSVADDHHVIFDAGLIDILRKYGVAGLTTGGTGVLATALTPGQAEAAPRLPLNWRGFTSAGRGEQATDAALAAVQDALKAGRPPNSGVPLIKPQEGPSPSTQEVLKIIRDLLGPGAAVVGTAAALTPDQAEAASPIRVPMPKAPPPIGDALAALTAGDQENQRNADVMSAAYPPGPPSTPPAPPRPQPPPSQLAPMQPNPAMPGAPGAVWPPLAAKMARMAFLPYSTSPDAYAPAPQPSMARNEDWKLRQADPTFDTRWLGGLYDAANLAMWGVGPH